MKILHTGDWHIGKIVNEFSMIEDQEFALEQLIEVVKEEKPNVIVIAGDIYDRSIPPVEAVELLDRIFSTILLDLNTPILAIAGNHDSAERLSFASRVLTQNGLHIAGGFSKEIKKITLEGDKGPVNFYLLPYADPKEIRHVLEDHDITNHDNAMKKIIDSIREDIQEGTKNVLVAHGYITNMRENNDENKATIEIPLDEIMTSDSERPLSIGGTDIIRGGYFDCFHYTALGHLHAPQRVGSDRMRYSGSLLKYSFSETNHKKGVTIVNIDETGEISVQIKQLKPKRDMRIIKGPLNELINPSVYEGTNLEDYIYAVLTDEEELIDPISKLRAVYPNIMGLSRETAAIREESRTSAAEGYQHKSKLELFREFYHSITGRVLEEKRLDVVREVIQEVEKEGR
ncbi:exonuclease SbcCD subunit D [Natronincola ferrireducens]|uniref:Nuclease SbcCD subunit D n=1 Tax=Natronincola ferrireducens TaxID=393762 RepID=A0A1G9AAS3_9FIRM|nr:exonuclease SbcCD subunit D [Natronincola ferrireducens]SDK24446.1 Exodeoxyribonuclease I subunit D [Natronincola ferrireducens]